MRFNGLLLFSFLLTIVVTPAFAQYTGDNNDGSSVAAVCANTLDGVDQFSFGTLTGSSTFCDFSNEGYTIDLNNPPQDIQFYWTVPPGATIVSGANTPSVSVAFDNTPGTVSVTVVTACVTQTFNMAVTNGSCSMYRGDNNDGFSEGNSCATLLDGTATINVAAVLVGSPTFCEGATESYSMQVDNAPANTYYNWTVPAGSVVTSGQGTNVVIVTFGGAPGNVSVDIITDCFVETRTLAVSPTNCTFYAGGDNDGYSKGPSCATTLDGTSVFSVTGITGSPTFCEFGTEGFTAITINSPAEIYYDWSVPADATIVSGQGTPNITVLFGNTSGVVSVNIITDCSVTSPPPFAVTATTCLFYSGGNNDGFSNTLNCALTLDGAPALTVDPSIVGVTTSCEFSTESYSIAVQGLSPESTITWSVPAGATIVSGQGTGTILVSFSNTSGDISVDVTNLCTVVSRTLSVTTTNCIFYAGGDNDGFSIIQSCVTDLNGVDNFNPLPIVGTAASCEFSTEAYSVSVPNAPVNTTYVWTVPAGATILSGQGTPNIFVSFGNTSGNISVAVSNDCTTKNVSLPVSIANCIFYSGGSNDGFNVAQSCLTLLDGSDAFLPSPIAGSASSCEFATEAYSITIPYTYYNHTFVWSVPAGAAIISGQGTTSVLIAFANNSGNVSVDVTNECGVTKTVVLPVSVANCIFYAGGNNDGFSWTQACTTTLDGTSALIPGPIVGVTNACDFSTELYSITVAGALPNTIYTWAAPPGGSIVSGQGTTTALIALGNTSGNVQISITNECETRIVMLPVTIANCIYYSGGNNDGFSQTRMCVATLNGGPAITAGAITGSTNFCNFATESYSITVTGAPTGTTYTWSGPAGSSTVSGQGTSSALIAFGNTSGNVVVAINDGCQVINVTLPVTATSCIFYAGGNSDGFSVTTVANIPLPVAIVSFDAEVSNGIVKLKWETSSEFENDYFLVERSADGKHFEALSRVEGAGTSTTPLKYQVLDSNPYHGTSYYRLSQTDYDGTSAFFKVLIVKVEDFAEITKLYPNPVHKDEQLHVDFFAEEDGEVKISVIDPAGRSSGSKMVTVKAGVNLFEFTPHFQTAGVHIIIIRSREKAEALRLVVL